MKVYLAGPMSGLPQFNFPLFDSVALDLRGLGYDVVSPVELDDEDDRGAAMESTTGDPDEALRTWGDYLSRDVKLIADEGIQGIVLLPNWNHSRGARLECTVGLLQRGFKFYTYDPEYKVLTKVHPNMIALELYNQFKMEKGRENLGV
jgi:hypothetical protein